jgi:threonine/homoserine/homoserine lactone efflux protein
VQVLVPAVDRAQAAGVPAELAAFVAVAAVVICSPGPDTALTVRNALVGGRRAGIGTAVGITTGLAVWTLAASAGVAGLLAASEPAFRALQLAGAAYLTYLGVQSLRAAWRGGVAAAEPSQTLAPARALRQGLLGNLGNPKIAVFFVGLLPQFAGPGAGFVEFALLGGVFCVMTFAWLTAYCVVVRGLGQLLRRPAVRRTLDGLTGAVLVGFGARLALEA